MFRVGIGEYELTCHPSAYPDLIGDYRARAKLAEHFDHADTHAGDCFVGVGRDQGWPFLVVTQRFDPAVCGFHPGALIVPETHRLFPGAGTRLLCYDLKEPRRLWVDETFIGFWFWAQHGDIVLMGAETELAAWTADGRKLWSRSVDPPWDYTVTAHSLDVKGCNASVRLNIVTGKDV